MFVLKLILIFVLHFEGVTGVNPEFVYFTSGQTAALLCPEAPTCSDTLWFYSRDYRNTFLEVENGKVSPGSHRAAGLSVDRSCSLIINNITSEDAGLYTCRRGNRDNWDKQVYVGVVSIWTSPPDAGPKEDGEVTLQCSLDRYPHLRPCSEKTVLWHDERGNVLLGEGDGYKFIRRMNCVSVLKVERQSVHNRKYTCKVTDEKNNVVAWADYTAISTGGTTTGTTNPADDDAPKPPGFGALGWSIIATMCAVMTLAALISTLVCCIRKGRKTQTADGSVEPNDGVSYASITFSKKPKNKARGRDDDHHDDAVTYTTVKAPSSSTGASADPSHLYATVRETSTGNAAAGFH